MAWICEQEGIEADAEALAVLAQAGEGSVRDSLSALDQAIACCGAQARSRRSARAAGRFLARIAGEVTQALVDGDSRRDAGSGGRTGAQRPQPAAFQPRTGALFPQSAGGQDRGRRDAPDCRIAPRSASSWRRSRRAFSEEDLTRYLQLSLDMFRDLQFSLQPRFHLEIGLVRLVQAGRLLPIEQALAGTWGRRGETRGPPRPSKRPATSHQSPPRGGGASPKPSPQPLAPELCRSPPPGPCHTSTQNPAPAAGSWRQKLHAALMELGMEFTS